MRVRRWAVAAAIGVPTAILLIACGGSDNEPAPPAEAEPAQSATQTADPSLPADEIEVDTPVTRAFDEALAGHPEVAKITPRINGVVVDDDPDSPVAASILFNGDGPAARIDFYGPKVETGQSADYALIQLREPGEALRVELGPNNVPESTAIPGFGALTFRYSETQMTVEFTGIDGRAESFSTDLERSIAAGEDSATQTLLLLPRDGGQRLLDGSRRPAPDRAVTITRGTRLEVTLQGLDPLPPGLRPFARTTDCTTGPNVSCSFWVQQHDNLWQMGIIHSIAALGGEDAAPEPDWPNIESCENARLVLGDWFGRLAASSVTPSAAPAGLGAFAAWFATLLGVEAAAGQAGLAAASGVSPAIQAGMVGAIFYSLGFELAEFLHGEVDCTAVIKRTAVRTGLLSAAAAHEFTVEICFPNLEGIVYQQRCQSVGPYRPFDGRVELGGLSFTAQKEAARLQVTAISVTDGRAGDPVGANVIVNGGEPPYAYTWNAPAALEPAGDFQDAAGGTRFTFAQGGVHPVRVTVRDADGQEITAETTARH